MMQAILSCEPGYVPGMLMREWHRQNSKEIELAEIDAALSMAQIADAPTIQTVAIRVQDVPSLPDDIGGEPFVKLIDAQKSTMELVEEAVHRYFELYHRYPHMVLLSPLRYLAIGWMEHFYPNDPEGPRLPLVCELPYDYQYDVMVR